MSLRQDEINCAHFVSFPGRSFVSALKVTGKMIYQHQEANIDNLFEHSRFVI